MSENTSLFFSSSTLPRVVLPKLFTDSSYSFTRRRLLTWVRDSLLHPSRPTPRLTSFYFLLQSQSCVQPLHPLSIPCSHLPPSLTSLLSGFFLHLSSSISDIRSALDARRHRTRACDRRDSKTCHTYSALQQCIGVDCSVGRRRRMHLTPDGGTSDPATGRSATDVEQPAPLPGVAIPDTVKS